MEYRVQIRKANGDYRTLQQFGSKQFEDAKALGRLHENSRVQWRIASRGWQNCHNWR